MKNSRGLLLALGLFVTAAAAPTGLLVPEVFAEEQVLFGTSVVDGTYPVEVETEEGLEVETCLLTVKNSHMTALLLMKDNACSKLYLGKASQAGRAPKKQITEAVPNASGKNTFTLAISVLDQKLSCASYDEETKAWTDHTLTIRSDSLPAEAIQSSEGTKPEDLNLTPGEYSVEVTMSGGSGRASIQSPTTLTVTEEGMTAEIVWSSNHYDYMIVDTVKYPFDGEAEFSTFEIPVTLFDHAVPVVADTTAMGTPHEIDYQFLFDSASITPKEEGSVGKTEDESPKKS